MLIEKKTPNAAPSCLHWIILEFRREDSRKSSFSGDLQAAKPRRHIARSDEPDPKICDSGTMNPRGLRWIIRFYRNGICPFDHLDQIMCLHNKIKIPRTDLIFSYRVNLFRSRVFTEPESHNTGSGPSLLTRCRRRYLLRATKSRLLTQSGCIVLRSASPPPPPDLANGISIMMHHVGRTDKEREREGHTKPSSWCSCCHFHP